MMELWKFIQPLLSAQTVAIVIIVASAFAVRDAATKYIKKTDNRCLKMESEIALLRLRLDKAMAIMVSCPSVPKENVSWLRDDKKNSRPPAKSLCERRCESRGEIDA